MLGEEEQVSRPWWVAGLIVVAVVAGFLRFWMPGATVVTVEEPLWQERSQHFLEALLDQRFDDMVADPPPIEDEELDSSPDDGAGSEPSQDEIVAQPGVTTMWIGAAAEAINERSVPGLAAGDSLKVAKQLMALLCTVLLVPFMVVSARLVGRRGALVAGGVVAVEPLAVGHSALLHTDALLMISWGVMAVSLLAAFDESRRYLGLERVPDISWWRRPALRLGLLAGFAGALALLTKASAALPVLTIFAVALSLHVGLVMRDHGSWSLLRRSLLPTTLVPLVAGTATLLLLWPALWTDPLARVGESLESLQLLGEDSPRFLSGSVVEQRDLRYYPLELVFRTSAWLLLLMPIALGWKVWARSMGHRPVMSRRNAVPLLATAATYLAALMLVSVKHGRFLLPLLPIVGLALGAIAQDVVRTLDHHNRRERRVTPGLLWPGIGVILLAACAHATFGLAPYQISHVNQLVGGQGVAQRNIHLGWGEGSEILVEQYREDRDDCPSWATTSWDIDGPWAPGCPDNRRDFSFLRGGVAPPEYIFRFRYDRQLGREPEELEPYLRANGRRVRAVTIEDVAYAELWVLRQPDG